MKEMKHVRIVVVVQKHIDIPYSFTSMVLIKLTTDMVLT